MKVKLHRKWAGRKYVYVLLLKIGYQIILAAATKGNLLYYEVNSEKKELTVESKVQSYSLVLKERPVSLIWNFDPNIGCPV